MRNFSINGLLGNTNENNIEKDKELLEKVKPKKVVSANIGMKSIIDEISTRVKEELSMFDGKIVECRSYEELDTYIEKCIANGVVAIDTETTGLDTFEDKIIGFSMYTPNENAIYVPLRHISYLTGQPLKNQVTLEEARTIFEKIKKSNVNIIMHNAKFDIKMIYNDIGIKLTCYWDSQIAAFLLNNTEPKALKWQYAHKILHKEKTYDYGSLFKKIDFRQVPIDVATPYAAGDVIETYELMKWQENAFKDEPTIYYVFNNIEMPLLPVVIDMELCGVCIDKDFAKELSIKYSELLREAEKDVYRELDAYDSKIKAYRIKQGIRCKLSTPINISSVPQLATILYDIIQVGVIDKKKPRGTDEEILKQIDIPLCKKILEYRGLAKLISTYIDKLPKSTNKKDGKIHAEFNQMGTDTGRFSSENPNLQNIPSHNDEIRKMFVAQPGYVLISSDYSQQEPRLLAELSQDKSLLDGYNGGKDVYSLITSMIYGRPYETCLEKYVSEEEKAKGIEPGHGQAKKLRGNTKGIVLGLMYGRQAPSVAEQIGVSIDEAVRLKDKFFEMFPKVKEFTDKMTTFGKKNGYEQTLWGRKRRLPDLQLPPYSFSMISGGKIKFNPLLFIEKSNLPTEVDDIIKAKYLKQLNATTKWKDRQFIIDKAKSEGIAIADNKTKIADGERQTVNSVIQGSAADMTKIAMINVYNSKLMDLGFNMLIPVHDEIIGEIPIENALEGGKLLSQIMREAPKGKCNVPMKCDVEYFERWYGESIDNIEEYAEAYKKKKVS